MLSLLELRSVDKTFVSADGVVVVLNDFSLSLFPGEFVSILGPSGCGKTTILRILAGLESPDQGEALVAGRPITGPSQGIGFLFQSYDCFPWKTVAGNVRAGLLNSGLAPAEYDEKVFEVLGQVSLTEFRNSFPHELSGGMRQRVALARTVIARPQVLLLDEPFGALDVQLRFKLQKFVYELFARKIAQGVAFATHDISEAVRISTRIVVLSPRPARIVYEAHTKRADPSAPTDEELLATCRDILRGQDSA